MHLHFDIAHEETVRAKWPHEIFLINLIFNHILVFAATFGVYSTFPLLVFVVPLTSFSITTYLMLKARQIARSNETWFVKSHWLIAASRNRMFMRVLIVACAIIGSGILLSKSMGWSKVATLAVLGGGGILPFMVSLLVLIVLGNDSLYQARHGKLPRRFVEQHSDLTPTTHCIDLYDN